MSSSSRMQRPVMDPMFLHEQKPPTRSKFWWISVVWRGFRWTALKLVSHPLNASADRLQFRREGWKARLAWSLGRRLLFAPVLLAAICLSLVFIGTHPKTASASGDPSSFGVYYDPVDFVGEDGLRLTGWLVPVIDARRVILHRDRLLHQNYPAVVLVHDHGQTPAQMLPLVAPLHEDGIVVLAIGLRGTGLPDRSSQTFGLDEAGDISAAVELLRRRPFIDPDRIAVVGIGTGANAAVLAAERDSRLAAIILADPIISATDVVRNRLGPDVAGLTWIQPMTKWAFELSYRRDLEELSLNQHQTLLSSRQVLRVMHSTTDDRLTAGPTEQIRQFCHDILRPWK